MVELKVYACPIGGTFFDELCLLMIGFDRGQRVPRTTIHFAHYVRSETMVGRAFDCAQGKKIAFRV